MDNIQKIEFNKTYIIEDIFSTGLTNISKFSSIIDISNYDSKLKINAFFCQIVKNKNSYVYMFPIECLKVCELILYIKTISNERTKDKILPFYFHIRKVNQKIIFLPINRNIRQLLFGLYSLLYYKHDIIKG